MAIDAATINANSTTAATSSSKSISGRQEASRTSLADSEQTFLALMTAQLKNQDPLSPVDSTQFTQQIVQMTGVEQQLLTNDLLKALVGMNDGGLTNSVDLIGKSVTTQSTKAALADGKASFDFNMPRAADSMTVEVLDAAGKTVATLDTAQLKAKGDHTVAWNGKDSTGKQLEDGGLYSLRITATDSVGSKITTAATSTSTGVVTAVSQENGQTVVTVGGRKIATTDITSVAQAAAKDDAKTASNSNTETSTQTPAQAA